MIPKGLIGNKYFNPDFLMIKYKICCLSRHSVSMCIMETVFQISGETEEGGVDH